MEVDEDSFDKEDRIDVLRSDLVLDLDESDRARYVYGFLDRFARVLIFENVSALKVYRMWAGLEGGDVP